MSDNILSLSGVSKAYEGRTLFDQITFGLDAGMHTGLIGDNGAGKSTLLQCILGNLPTDAGHIALRQGTRMAYLAQTPVLPAVSVGAYLQQSLGALQEAITRYEASVAIGHVDADAQERIEQLGGWQWQHRIDSVAQHLGLADLTQMCDTLSGGQKKRAALARVVLSEPDLILLDEPTNHLDTDTVAWLEGWLQASRAACIVVTHDRYFLDQVAHQMAELQSGRLRIYPGNYADYLDARAVQEALEERTASRRSQVLKAELEWARRGPKARTTKSRARLQRIDASVAELAARPVRHVLSQVSMAQGHRLGKTILELEQATVAFSGKPLFEPVSVALCAGERWGVVGPNGTGKTSLLRMIEGQLPCADGTVVRGVNTHIAYFDQHRAVLDPKQAVRDVLVPAGGDTVFVQGQPVHVASYLQRFAFPQNAQHMRVGQLSGGEQNRLALARFLLAPANLYLLDEPTNDLDLLTLAVLENAMITFEGCVLVVSHDRYFLDKVVTGIMAFEKGPSLPALVAYQGSFSDYQAYARLQVQSAVLGAAGAAGADKKTPPKAAAHAPKLTYAETRELAAILERIEKHETKLAAVQEQVADPALWSKDAQAGLLAQQALETLQNEVTAMYARWEDLQARQEAWLAANNKRPPT